MIETIVAEGLVYGIMALGVFISFRILDFPDLTVDGSFPLGSGDLRRRAGGRIAGSPDPASHYLRGFAAGSVTALIHTRLGVPHLLAGILTMTMLYSVNLRVQGNRPNISFLRYDTLLDRISTLAPQLSRSMILLLTFLIIAVAVKILLDVFFHTDLGLTMGALGSNEQMVKSQGVNPQSIKVIGLGMSNALVALSAIPGGPVSGIG
jgi:putative ABC transport system permease protein